MAADPSRAAFDAATRRALPVVYGGVGAFYLVLVGLSPFLGGAERPDPALVVRWALTGVAGVAGGALFLRRPAPEGWGNALAGALGAVAVLNSLALVDAAGPGFVFALTIALVAFALFLLSMAWTALLCALGLGGWLLLAWQAGGGPEWTPRTINLVAIVALALVAQAMRLGLHGRLEAMRQQDAERARQRHELEREAALGEQRRRILLRTAHELSTPMTPVLLEAHALARQDLPPQARHQLEVLQRNLERLKEAIASAIRAAKDAEAEGAPPRAAASEGGGGEDDGSAGGGGAASEPEGAGAARPGSRAGS
jgi:signal transduction histidine kinase